VVLAIDALEIAIGEKNIADTPGAANGRLLSFVDAYRCNTERSIAFAKT